jgi:hypothetical protein
MGVAVEEMSEATAKRALPCDPALPALADLFPPAGAAQIIGRLAREVGIDVDVTRATVEYVRYRPTRTCTVLWSVPRADAGPLLVSVKAFGDEKAKAILDRPRLRHRLQARPLEGWRYSYLADKRLLLTVYPFDVRLRGLALGASVPWARRHLLPLLGSDESARITDITPLSYKPWRRCVLRYTVEHGGSRSRWFAKVFRDDRGQPMVNRLRAIATHLRDARTDWEILAPVAYGAEARLLVFAAMEDGRPLKQLIQNACAHEQARAELMRWVAAAAEGLAAFQQTAVGELAAIAPNDTLAKFRRDLSSIRSVAPDLARAIDLRLKRLEETMRELLPEDLVPTHGAFRYGQLLVCGARLVVLDLDTLCLSGASADAGNFLAYLDYLALRRPRLRGVAAECAERFVEALPARARGAAGWLAWYRAASHMKLAVRSFFSLAEDWPHASDGLLALCDAAIANPTEANILR